MLISSYCYKILDCKAPFVSAVKGGASQTDASRALIRRVVPSRAAQFAVEIIPATESGKDIFEIESIGGKIVLRGNNGVSVASALNRYLKEIAKCHFSWCGDQIELPRKLACVPKKIRVINPYRYRVMFNYCTFNYSCSWWDRRRWERELDFLAMQGVNTPLGVMGLEAVWYDTLVTEGFSDVEARSFLIGPAHSAWQWMTNLENLGDPMPRSWIESRRTLGRWWIDRAESLGMTPIRQGFSGYVPHLLKAKHPEAIIATQPSWCGYPGSSQLDPLDPYFKKIGSTFMKVAIRNYGEGHIWAADPFHESEPPKPGEKYLNDVGASIYSLMREVDPKAIWAMQAWSIRKPIADAIPKGSLLVLDLSGEKNGFWGHDYVKGRLHNFGGRINLHGDLKAIASNPFAARSVVDDRCIGMGLFPEGIGQNPVFYELFFDLMWHGKPVDIGPWLHEYAQRRYGIADADTDRAWQLLLEEGPYREATDGVEKSSMIAARPALVVKKSGPNDGFFIPYDTRKLEEARNLLLSKEALAGNSEAYRYDVADLTRQTLSNLLQQVQKEIRLAYLNRDEATFDKEVSVFDAIMEDVDRLLASRREFLFGKWLTDARSFGATPAEKAYLEKEAAMLVTLWGPEKDPSIFDYSWREWSGLINAYYRKRWARFHAYLRKSINKGDYRDPDDQVYGRESFRANAFYRDLAEWEISFVNRHNPLPSKPNGNTLAIARELATKYAPLISIEFSPERIKTLDSIP